MTRVAARTILVIVCCAVASALAQTPAAKTDKSRAETAAKPPHRAARKGAAKASPAKKAPAAVANAYAAMPADQRLAIQADLALTGYYEGLPGGDFTDERAVDAVKLFRQAGKGKDTGILSDEERARLAAAAEPHRQAIGWHWIEDPATGARFAVPAKLVSATGRTRTGSRWASGHHQIEIEDFSLAEANLPALFEQEKRLPRGRWAEASALTPDSFFISGTQGLKNIVVRAQSSGSAVRGITIAYDQAMAGTMAGVALAMANSFQGFPDPNAVPPTGQQRGVEYGTAIVADRNGDLLTARQATSDCDALMVPVFGHAVRIAEDAANDLVLIRLYGARDLVPAALAAESHGDDLTLVGIADPAAQQGRNAVTEVAAHLDGPTLAPVPKLGFAGAAAFDTQGSFAGMVALASPATGGSGAATQQAKLVPAAAVRAFLAAHGIAPASRNGPLDQSVVRVICVRK